MRCENKPTNRNILITQMFTRLWFDGSQVGLIFYLFYLFFHKKSVTACLLQPQRVLRHHRIIFKRGLSSLSLQLLLHHQRG